MTTKICVPTANALKRFPTASAVAPPTPLSISSNIRVNGGVITEILVREGDLVGEGDLLLKLDQTRSQSNLGENMAERSGLIVRAARLRAMVDGQPFEPTDAMLAETPDIVYQEKQLYDSRLEELEVQKDIARNQLKQRREELRELGVRRGQLGRELELATEELSRTTPMIE